ncbi:30S ribosomal protein S18 [Candidatus Microgenomates bacterium]|nr:30S ribosomal protein S18 [Candidatus Microgenomates bacterium]
MYRKPREIKVKKNCPFCREKTNPDFKDIAGMKKYLSERGKIIGRSKTGVCAKHQKRMAQAIKRARYIALIPFVAGI